MGTGPREARGFKRLREKRKGTTTTGSLLESFEYSKGGRVAKKNETTHIYSLNGQPAPWGDAVKRIELGSDGLEYGYHPSYGLMTSIQGRWQGSDAELEIGYDVDRQLRTLSWSSGVTRQLAYSPSGERVAMSETGGAVSSFVSYAGPHYERVDTGSNVAHVFRFSDGEGNVLVEERVEQQLLPDGTTLEQSVGYQQLARDYRGSVAAILPNGGEVSRRSYEAFGGSSATTRTDLGYTGHRDLQVAGSPLGLIDMGGRMYDPVSAQFTSADPFMPNAASPKGYNRPAYVVGDPINRIDPTGFRDDCNPSTGCGTPTSLPSMPAFDSTTPSWGSFVHAFYKNVLGGKRRADRRAERREERRYRRGFVDLRGGGAAPNTAGILNQAASAIDKYHLRALNVASESVTGAGDLLTMRGSEWVRNKLFGEGAMRTDSAAAYVGAGGGFVIGGGVQAIRAIPSAVRAIPGVVRALPGVIRAVPGAIRAAGQSVANFLLRRGAAKGARGLWGGRPFGPSAAGGAVRSLSTEGVRVTPKGIDVLEGHLARFGPDAANSGMITRLRGIASGQLEATAADLNFYTHELREFVRYRRLGFAAGAGEDYVLWNNAHTATLADYGLVEGPGVLYHPSVVP